MIERMKLWIADRRRNEAARDALCDHDGSEPMCSRCAAFFNGV